MELISYKPHAQLAHLVEVFWYQKSYAPAHSHERLLPDGSMELVIGLDDDPLHVYDGAQLGQQTTLTGGLISGAHSKAFAIDAEHRGALIGVHFKAGGAFPLLGLPAGELHNQHVSLHDLWGSFASEVRERLLAASTIHARFAVLQAALLTRLAAQRERHAAVSFALNQFVNAEMPPSVAAVTQQIGMSQRHFIQLFRNQVGMTPKKFCRVQRFQRVLYWVEQVGDGYTAEWSQIALNCGYFDQAHFIRDFQQFSGLTPTAYVSQKGKRFNHVPVV